MSDVDKMLEATCKAAYNKAVEDCAKRLEIEAVAVGEIIGIVYQVAARLLRKEIKQ